MGLCSHQLRPNWAPRSWKRQERPSPGAFRGRAALGHLDLRRGASRTERINGCCLKLPPPGLCVVICYSHFRKHAPMRALATDEEDRYNDSYPQRGSWAGGRACVESRACPSRPVINHTQS